MDRSVLLAAGSGRRTGGIPDLCGALDHLELRGQALPLRTRARGSEADAEERVDRGDIPFGRCGPACRQGADSGDGSRRVEVVHECGAQPIEDTGGPR